MSLCTHVYTCMWRPEVDTEYLLQGLSTFCFKIQILKESKVHKAHRFARLPVKSAPALRLQEYSIALSILVHSRDSISGPHACALSSLPTESLPQFRRSYKHEWRDFCTNDPHEFVPIVRVWISVNEIKFRVFFFVLGGLL